MVAIKDNAQMQTDGQMIVGRYLRLEDSSTLTLGDNLDVNGDLYIGDDVALNGGRPSSVLTSLVFQ